MTFVKFLSVLFIGIVSAVSAQSPFEGLTVEYYNGRNFDRFISSTIDKRIGFSRRLESPAPGVAKEFFSMRWTGSLIAPRTGLYTFNVIVDDGVKLWVNHELLIDSWIEQEATNYSATIFLDEGQTYDLKIEYFNSIVHSVLQIQWELPPEKTPVLTDRFIPIVSIPSVINSESLTPERTPKRSRENLMVNNVQNPEGKSSTEKKIEEKAVEEIPLKAVVVKKESVYKKEEPIVLRTVIFEQQSAMIPNDAYGELEELITYLKKYPNKKIEIRGHTDYAGDSLDNHQLSEIRAKAVANYLIKEGINSDRVSSKGFGGTHPVILHKELEYRTMNRRVEFIIRDLMKN
jgi:outer membrane protein OmpA-like peptidoglycan-associated protein